MSEVFYTPRPRPCLVCERPCLTEGQPCVECGDETQEREGAMRRRLIGTLNGEPVWEVEDGALGQWDAAMLDDEERKS